VRLPFDREPVHQRLTNHADFRHLFETYAEDVPQRLNVTRAGTADCVGNETLPRIHWNGDPIEMTSFDCGRTVQANEGWVEIFVPSFIPDVSWLIMHDCRLHANGRVSRIVRRSDLPLHIPNWTWLMRLRMAVSLPSSVANFGLADLVGP
jgi:hypothetical protein